MSLGQYLRQLRDARDLSLREFAKKLECSAAFISDVELGRRYPSEKVLADIARVLDVSIEDLKSQDDRPPTEGLKRMISTNHRYAVAFRRIVDEEPSADELLDALNRIQSENSSKKR